MFCKETGYMVSSCRIAQRRAAPGDPHDCTDAADQLSILRAVCDTLVKRTGTTHAPNLALRWDVDASARDWRFDLRPDHRFHDGTPCDAAAVARSLRRMARADKGYTLGAPGVWRQYLGDAVIEAADARTLSIRLDEPLADLLDILEQGFIVAPDTLDRWDANQVAEIIGSGPYRITDRTGTSITAARVPAHFAQPEFDTITWIAEPDPQARLRMLRDGTADIACDLGPDAARGSVDGQVALHEYTSPVAIIFLLNAAGPLADARLRRALNLAVDRDGLVADVMAGHATPLHGFVSAAHFGAVATDVPHDPDQARRLIADAGYGDGLTLGIDCPTRLPDEAEALCEVLRRQVSDVGITLGIHVHEDREAYAHMVRRKEIRDMCVFDSSPMSTFRVLYEKIDSRVAGSWWQGYRNTDVETLLDRARRETSHDDRGIFYAQAYEALQADPAWLTLYTHTRAIGLAFDHPRFALGTDRVLDVADLRAPCRDAG